MNHLFPGQQRLAADSSKCPDQRRGRAEKKVLPLRHRPVKGDAENFNIHIGSRVDNHLAKAANPQQFSLNPVQIELPQLLDGDGNDLFCGIGAIGFFLHIVLQIGGTVSKGAVLRKFGLPRRNQPVPIADIVNIPDGKTAALPEERAENFPVDPLAGGFRSGL